MKYKFVRRYLGATSIPPATHQSWPHRSKTIIAAFFTTFLIAYISHLMLPPQVSNILVASIGASSILVFILHTSPVSQPHSLILGNVLAAVIGVCCALLPLPFSLSAALCLSLCFLMMFMFSCVHPPAGATALMPLIMGSDAVNGFYFVVFPVLINVLLLIFIASFLHKFWLKTEYPSKPLSITDNTHKKSEASPLSRLGLAQSDLKEALKSIDAHLNISEKDLATVYQLAQQQMFNRRFGDILCRDIMSKDIISVSKDTSLEVAWNTLKHHKINLLPVLDQKQGIIGVLSLVDYLKHLQAVKPQQLYQRMQSLLFKKNLLGQKMGQSVSSLMISNVITITADEPVTKAILLLSDGGFHHIPVVSGENKLVGMISQSDIIAALYASATRADELELI